MALFDNSNGAGHGLACQLCGTERSPQQQITGLHGGLCGTNTMGDDDGSDDCPPYGDIKVLKTERLRHQRLAKQHAQTPVATNQTGKGLAKERRLYSHHVVLTTT